MRFVNKTGRSIFAACQFWKRSRPGGADLYTKIHPSAQADTGASATWKEPIWRRFSSKAFGYRNPAEYTTFTTKPSDWRSLLPGVPLVTLATAGALLLTHEAAEDRPQCEPRKGDKILPAHNEAANQIKTEEVKVDLPTDKLVCHRAPPDQPQEREQVVLLAPGSFNPPTFMHLRMLELAREALLDQGYDVLGAYLSPVNGSYGKKGLAAAEDRIRMCHLATAESPFIMVDPWEALQVSYQRTLRVLQRLDRSLNPESTTRKQGGTERVRVMLVCGADLLESFAAPGVWIPDQLHAILGEFGVVCISRNGGNARRFVDENDLLYQHRKRIVVVDDWIRNDVSASKLRQNTKRGLSIKYLTPDDVIKYIEEHGLYKE